MINDSIYKIIISLREQATDMTVEVIDIDDDDFISVEADNFEELLGNYLISNVDVFNTIKNNNSYAIEFGDLLNVDWSDFLNNVEQQVR